MTAEIEYALMVAWPDGVEYVPAQDARHAARMAKTIYRGQTTYTVGREVQPWRYVREGDARLRPVLSDELAR